jgi:RsiW-degrading membrane proteinase PrsW (M82 family)
MAGVMRVALAAAACALAAASLGCAPTHLAGTNDAALDYSRVPPVPAATAATAPIAATAGAVLAAEMKARLVSAQVPADVELLAAQAGEPSERVRVVVDADIAGFVDELLTWRGGVAVYLVDGQWALEPRDTTGVRPMTVRDGDGRTDRWWQGTAAAVARVVRESTLDATRVAFAEPLPDGSGEWRTRVVVTPAITELGLQPGTLDAIEPVAHGRALSLTPSAAALAALARERSRHPGPGEKVALARGATLLRTMPFSDALAPALVVHFGDDITAYTRAYRTRVLLSSPPLPALERISAARVPPRWGLATACALLPFAFSFGWLSFVRRFDRTRPEPPWLVVATFALGGVAIVPAALIEIGLARASPWLDPSLATLGGQPWALPLAIPVFAVTVGLVEEGAKLLGVWALARRRREFDEPVDGIVYGCAAALGFAAVENVKYFALGRMSGAIIALRTVMTVPAHMFFGAIWGYAMGARLVSRRVSVLGFLALAALAHGAFDALLSTDGAQLAATLVMLALAGAFIAMLQRALRFGAVPRPDTDRGEPPVTERLSASTLPRTYWRVGDRRAFVACAGAMLLCAFALTVLGSAYEYLHHRAGVVFVALAGGMLALFALAGYGTSATIPLDVALDAWGITFAGGRTPWSAVVRATVAPTGAGKRAIVRVQTLDGVLSLGPTSAETARALAEAITLGRA